MVTTERERMDIRLNPNLLEGKRWKEFEKPPGSSSDFENDITFIGFCAFSALLLGAEEALMGHP